MSSAHPSGCPPPTLTNQQSLASSGAPELEGELMLLTVHRQVIIVRESLHGRQAAYHYLQTHAPVVDVLVSASVGTISMVHRTPAGVTGSWKLTTPTTASTSHAATQLRPHGHLLGDCARRAAELSPFPLAQYCTASTQPRRLLPRNRPLAHPRIQALGDNTGSGSDTTPSNAPTESRCPSIATNVSPAQLLDGDVRDYSVNHLGHTDIMRMKLQL